MLSTYLFTRETGLTNPRELRSAQLARQYTSLVRSELRYFPSRHSGTVNCLAVDNTEQTFMLSGGSDSRILLWDLNSREGQRHRYVLKGSIPAKQGHRYGISGLLWWPFDSGMAVTCSFDETVKIWDTQSLDEVYAFSLGMRVNAIDVSQVAEHCLVACAADCPPIRLLDLRSSASAQMLTGHQGPTVQVVKWSPIDPFMLASGGADGTVRLWDIRRTNACLTVMNLENMHGGYGTSMPYSREAFSTPQTSLLENIKSHRGVVNSLAWLADGRQLVSAGTDEMIRVWDVSGSPSLMQSRDTNTLVNFGPTVRNRYLQCINMVLSPVQDCFPQILCFPSDTGEILMFNVATGRLIRRLSISANTTTVKRTRGLVFRGSEYVELYSGNSDGDIILWEAPRHGGQRHKRTTASASDRKSNILTEIYKGLEVT
ncbi:WD40-repeat-containing domain protein [Limtongia smithiae]|uniref:WD40-repeat-containing domain protein n=1 Tax=Limtongia smithiae TaxID=1125753 RepID=UPI0034CF182F